ncbi:hypothetical protein HDV06_002433 [Boothiomyces sp. JEL0866]|nr:hypothetical protein HDV06_002433 [Boothiomyces sp. JEL0866]
MSIKLIESQNPDGIRERLLKNQQDRRLARAQGCARIVCAPLQYPSFKLPPVKIDLEQSEQLESMDTISDGNPVKFSKRTYKLPKRGSQTIKMSLGKLKRMMAEQAIEKRMHSLGFANYLNTKKKKSHFSSDSILQSKLNSQDDLHPKSQIALDESTSKARVSKILPPLDISFKAMRRSELLESKVLFEKIKNPNEKDLPLKKKLNKALVGPREILSVAPRKETPKYKPPKKRFPLMPIVKEKKIQ